MAKHIVVEIASNANFTKALVRAISQTHIGSAFGNTDGGRKFVAKNGLVLGSNLFPAKDDDFKATNTLWLMGAGTAKQNETSFAVSKAVASKLQEAILDYNFYYSVGEINKRVAVKRAAEEAAARRQSSPCSVTVG